MSLTLAVALSTALLGAPSAGHASAVAAALPTKTPTAKLTDYILRTNPKTKRWARLLAERILVEAKRFKINPALLTAVAFNESWFDRNARGTSDEHGVWQLWPRAQWLAPGWDRLRTVMRGLPGWPDRDWGQLGRKLQIKASRDLVISTFLAAHLLARHLRKCGAQTPRCAARYNSGNHRVRPGYVWHLRRRVKAVRKALSP